MKPHFISVITGLLISILSFAQNTGKPKLNALSFELGKTGLIYNLSYDHRFGGKNFGVRFVTGSNLAKYLNAVSAGAGVYHLAGKRNHFFEIGADIQYLVVDEVSDDEKGFALVYPDYSIKTFYASLNFGYRRYGKSGLFRIGFSPGIFKNGFVPGGYISYGLIF